MKQKEKEIEMQSPPMANKEIYVIMIHSVKDPTKAVKIKIAIEYYHRYRESTGYSFVSSVP